MAKVTGIGGTFFKVTDPAATRAWYAEHLGMAVDEFGCTFTVSAAQAIWSPFKATTDYFGPGDQPFMFNLTVDDLDALLVDLRAKDVELVGEPIDESYGKFAWIRDCDGYKVELWEAKGSF